MEIFKSGVDLLQLGVTAMGGGAVLMGMIEIYLVTSLAPVPLATMVNREWGQIGQGYLKSLFALGFQAVLMIICVAIYAVLVRSIAVETDVVKAIWTAVGYTVLLCFCLFKTSSLSRSILGAH